MLDNKACLPIDFSVFFSVVKRTKPADDFDVRLDNTNCNDRRIQNNIFMSN